MHILGISCFYHDAAAALLQDGLLVAAAEEERFSRRKHDSGFPSMAVEFCLRQGGITAADLDYVVFYEKPVLKLERILLSGLRTYPRAWQVFGDSTLAWLGEKLWVREIVHERLGVDRARILFAEHHAAHAASAFFCSPFASSALITLDGVGEWATTAIGHGTADWGDGTIANRITLDRELHFPHSLGLLYSAFTAWLGFEVNEGEYKVMGMAPYGTPRYVDEVNRLLLTAGDGSFRLDPSFFSFQHSAEQSFGRRFERLFGPPRPPDAPFVLDGMPGAHAVSAELLRANRRYADVAASVQHVTEEVILGIAAQLRRESDTDALCLAGGVAMNSVANGRVALESGFDRIFIQPAAGDAGGAVGAALYMWHVVLGKPRTYVMEHAYLGEACDVGAFVSTARATGAPLRSFSSDDGLTGHVADALADGAVVGWVQGRFEWGSRALGNRSILADPRRTSMKERVNEKIKFRELFRPFAPSVLDAEAPRYFRVPPTVLAQYPTRFMQYVLPYDPTAKQEVPAVDHEGTGRLQIVRREWNQPYAGLLEAFQARTGVPMLMNTSFNLRGEPIVSSGGDALRTFLASGLDLLVVGDVVLEKSALRHTAGTEPGESS